MNKNKYFKLLKALFLLFILVSVRNVYAYSIDEVKTVNEYDSLIQDAYGEHGSDVSKYELLLLQRDFVNKVGYNTIQSNKSNNNFKTAVEWLMGDLDNIRLYIYGGAPDGSYVNSLKILGELLTKHRSDLSDSRVTNGIHYGDVYRKLMISLSLTHSKTISFWIPSKGNANPNPNVSNAITRYEIYHDMFENGKLDTKIFRQLEIEEMRYVTSSYINDDEILWLHDYIGSNRNPHLVVKYIKGTEPNQTKFFNKSTLATYEKKYKLSGYGVANIANYPKLWMVIEVGGVCWRISNFGQNMNAVYGIPSFVVSQTAHSSFYVYSLDNNGNGIWTLNYDMRNIYNTFSESYDATRSYHKKRLIADWGHSSWSSKWTNASYILLGQAAMNDYSNYVKAEELVALSNVYKSNSSIREQLLREAVSKESFNLDAWANLVELYNKDSNKSEADMISLAGELANSLKYYPVPCNDLLKFINNNCIKDGANKVAISNIINSALEAARNAQSSDVLQSNDVMYIANLLLNNTTSTKLAELNIDTRELSLTSEYRSRGTVWDYSVDEGKTWKKQITDPSVILTDEELEIINEGAFMKFSHDIYVHLNGAAFDDNNYYKITVDYGPFWEGYVVADDVNNKLVFKDTAKQPADTLFWRYKGEKEWKSYLGTPPDLRGDVTIEVKTAEHYDDIINGVVLNRNYSSSFSELVAEAYPEYVPTSYTFTSKGENMVGDLNGNKSIDLSDVLIELKLFFSQNATPEQLKIGDMNDDGGINLTDILMLLKLFFKN